jgi:glycosyltransferase involved in cell wall biosynthesis
MLHRKGRLKRAMAAARFAGVTARVRPHVIHVNQAGATRVALLAGACFSIPVLPHVRLAEDVAYLEALNPPRNAVPAIVCISKYIQSMFRTLRDRTVVMYNSYALRNPPREIAEARTGQLRIACVGRVAPVKGQDVLVRAAATLRSRGRAVSVQIVGASARDTPYARSVADLAHELRIAAAINWFPFDHEPMRFLSSATAAVCCSHVEPLGRTVLEAWDAAALPIVYSGSGGAAEIIRDSGGGLLYDKQEGDCLASAIELACDMESSTRREMIERGRSWLRENTNRAAYASRLTRLWEAAAVGR